jgi:predicted  nucleic acid-binding Zn-ribbon protein
MTSIQCKGCMKIIIEDIENSDLIDENFFQCPYCYRIIENPFKK